MPPIGAEFICPELGLELEVELGVELVWAPATAAVPISSAAAAKPARTDRMGTPFLPDALPDADIPPRLSNPGEPAFVPALRDSIAGLTRKCSGPMHCRMRDRIRPAETHQGSPLA
jgi:hypothetical protein